ncbi:hypothetical protein Tco_0232549 [Tanacetum coccineum]
MESKKYLEGQSMQRPPLFESDGFIYWKNRFKTYVKSKDLDLWHVITDGDFPPIQNNPETKKDEVVPFHKQNDDLKKKLAKNNEAKMVIYNAFPRKEYERIFMCQTAKEIWDTLLTTHQGNKERLPKWSKAKRKNKSITLALKLKKEVSDEIAQAPIVKTKSMPCRKRIQKFFKRQEDICGDPNHLIGECSKPPKNNDQRAFIGGAWSDNGEDEVGKTKLNTQNNILI